MHLKPKILKTCILREYFGKSAFVCGSLQIQNYLYKPYYRI